MTQQQLKPEALARKHIDKHLAKTGWKLLKQGDNVPSKGAYVLPEFEVNGKFADYAFFIDGEIWAICEAKKEGDESLEHALVQAVERYAKPLNVKYVYAANTKLDRWNNTILNLIFRDLRIKDSKSRELFSFHTPRGLKLLDTYDEETSNKQLIENPAVAVKGGLRYYQAEAINAIEKALSEKKRKMLLHMATGTGKTFTIVSSIFRILSTNPKRFKRILFLVDRRELANQAVTAFATFDAVPGKKFDEIYEVYCDRIPSEEEAKVKFNSKLMHPSKISSPKEGDAHVYVTTIQRLYQQITGRSSFKSDEEEDEMEWEEKPIEYNPKIPIDAFDLIISDESHRSIYNLWEVVLQYFDAVQIGLTATPTARTFVFFDRNLVYRYSLKQAITDGYLVDYDVVRIRTESTKEGAYIPKEQRLLIKDRQTGLTEEEFFEEDIPIKVEDIEKNLTIPDRLRKIAREFKKYYKEGQKTLVFAKHDNEKGSHADALVKAFREEFGYGNDKVFKITYRCGKDARTLIKKFRNSVDEAWIVVTVDMLSTGVDIPRIENIIIDRIVQSRVLYEQMMGRGTRLCKEISKTHFTVFDTLGVCKMHKDLGGSAFDEDYTEPSKSLPIKRIIDKIYRGIRKEYYIEKLVKRLQRIAKKLPPAGQDEFALYDEIPNGDLGAFASALPEKLEKDFRKHFEIFKDEGFVELLEKWSKYDAKKLLIAPEYIDTAESEQFFSTTTGEQLKPDDYIESFVKYIKENDDKIDALELLMKKPKELKLKDLKELAKTLKRRPEKFSIERLNKALQLSSKEELRKHSEKVLDKVSELISYIKYAEKDKEFLSLTERIDNAAARILTSENFTLEQLKWFNIIKDFVITRLKITKEDINSSAVFRNLGGYVHANKLFNNKLDELMKTLNEAIL
ncbi:MAG: DEAD/DEAH box helicase family protein [Candidatus Heimdallarchaeaceae archaeon]